MFSRRSKFRLLVSLSLVAILAVVSACGGGPVEMPAPAADEGAQTTETANEEAPAVIEGYNEAPMLAELVAAGGPGETAQHVTAFGSSPPSRSRIRNNEC